MPWYATIPLTAVLVRGALLHYLFSVPKRKREQIQTLLHPLVNARADNILATSKEWQDLRSSNEKQSTKVWKTNWQIFLAKRRAFNRTGKAFGAPRSYANGIVNFGLLIAFTEAIRLKCGASTGLLSTLLSPVQWVAHQLSGSSPTTAPKAEVPSPDDVVLARWKMMQNDPRFPPADRPTRTEDIPTRAEDILSGTDTATPILNGNQTDAALEAAKPYLDPSMHTEGLAWFTDLTLPDASGLMPGLLCLTFAASVLLRPIVGVELNKVASMNPLLDADDSARAAAAKERIAASSTAAAVQQYFSNLTKLQRLGIMVSMIFGVAAMQMPVAILLYMIPSIITGWVQSRWLNLKYPLSQPIQKCERPMRVKVGRGWGS